MHAIENVIEIGATPDAGWRVIDDVGASHGWQQFMEINGGKAVANDVLRLTLRPPGGTAVTFDARVVAAEPNRRLAWAGTVGTRGLFDTLQSLTLERHTGGTRLVHREEFRGPLVWLFRLLGEIRKAKSGFEHFDSALKRGVEGSIR